MNIMNNLLRSLRSISLASVFPLTLVATACGSGGLTTPPDDRGKCGDFKIDVEETWNSSTKVDLRANILGRWGGEIGVEAAKHRAESVVTSMDLVTSDWVLMSRTACIDHFERGIGTAESYSQKVSCFNRVLARQRNVIIALGGGEEAALEALLALSEELSSCG